MVKVNLTILKNRWAYFLLGVLFVCLGISMYMKSMRRVRFNEQSNMYHEAFEISVPAKLKIFFVEWCGHCKNFKPIYENELPKLIKENKINCEVEPIDAEANKEVADVYGVSGYPTVILELADGTKIPYEGPREATPIIDFLKSNIQTN